ncbi:cation diffusion facilitator family transporter [Thermoproteota archaeon]
MEDPGDFFERGEKAAKVGFLAVSVVGALKGLIGFFSSSVSLQAQSIESLTDLFSLAAVYVGMRLSKKPPSERFPYGYYRFETLASLAIATLILITGGGILRESILMMLNPQPISAKIYAMAIAASSIPVLYLLSNYTERVGSEINSQALLSQAADFKADIYSSFLVLVGIGASTLGYPIVEGLVGSLMSIFVLKMGATFAWQALLVLMDAVVNPDRIMQIKEIAEEVRGVRGVSRIRIRRSGPFCLGEVTIGVDQRLPVEQAHRISEEVERRVKKEIPSVESLIIHIEPQKQERLRVAIPVLEDKGMGSPVMPHFGEAPYFLFVDVEGESIYKWFTRHNPALGLDRKRGVTVSELINGEDTTTLLTAEIGEGPFHILRDSFVEIYELPEKATVEEAVKIYLEGKLKRMEEASEGKKQQSKTT